MNFIIKFTSFLIGKSADSISHFKSAGVSIAASFLDRSVLSSKKNPINLLVAFNAERLGREEMDC